MSSSKPFCVICERPTADGAVQASHVDKEKLQTWFLNVCGEELAEQIDDHHLICFFCVWHAEFLVKHGIGGEEIRWWPQDRDYLDDAAKELRKCYFDGKVEQCWVQLDQIDAANEDENEFGTVDRAERKKCFYCENTYNRGDNLAAHMKKSHENAIRCDNWKCTTYFHTVEEREKHAKEFHDKIIQCSFCVKHFQGNPNYHQHVQKMHAEYSVKCAYFGCLLFFKSKIEMTAHFDSAHKEENEAKIYKCNHCEYKAKESRHLERHVAAKHLPKTIKCGKCDKWFSSSNMLAIHNKREHTFKICSLCQSDVAARNVGVHAKKRKCRRCKNTYDCTGLLQSHMTKCKKSLFKCDKCPKSFHFKSQLSCHVKIAHRAKQWRGLQNEKLGFKCQPCKIYFKSSQSLRRHLNYKHTEGKLKHCEHCPKSFRLLCDLKRHLCEKHDLIEGRFECYYCQKKFFAKSALSLHIQRSHLKERVLCPICGKEMLASSMKTHLTCFHNQYY